MFIGLHTHIYLDKDIDIYICIYIRALLPPAAQLQRPSIYDVLGECLTK